MKIKALDHLVLTTPDIPQVVDFYTEVLGMEKEVFGGDRIALRFGNQKINLHEAGNEISPHAESPQPGSLDICLVVEAVIEDIVSALSARSIEIELGPVTRTGAQGEMESVYIRDPERNLLEISTYARPRA